MLLVLKCLGIIISFLEQANTAELSEEEFQDTDSRGKANWMLLRLEFYGWIEAENDKSDVQRVKFEEYAIKIIKILTEI